jgi:hypothetical protein
MKNEARWLPDWCSAGRPARDRSAG